MKIVGIENKSGEYQGREYNNYVVHALDKDSKVIGGMKCVNIKFKASNLADICDLNKLDSLVGKEIEAVYYDRYGNASAVIFVK